MTEQQGICHLPLWRMNPGLLWLLTFNNPCGISGWSEALCAPGNLVGQFSRSAISDSLQPHGLQHTWLPCPSPSRRVCSIESVMSSNHIILCHHLLLLPSIFPSISVFSNELALCIRRPKYWSFIFSISLSDKYSRLTSFRIDWFDPVVQGTFKSLLQHHNLKASIFQCSALFKIQLSHLYMSTGKLIALTI